MKQESHHIHRRKRIHQKFEKFPHKNKWIRFLDSFLLIIAILGPLMDFPQIFKIYYFQTAIGVSVLSWSLYAIFDIPWIIYGYVHKEKPIMIAYSFWFITNTTVVVGAVLYG